MEKKILKTGPYRPKSGREAELPILQDKEIRRDWPNEAGSYKAPPYILGYTGKIAKDIPSNILLIASKFKNIIVKMLRY